jgi:tetratricopeptide (TPR) repeat protein
LDTFGARGASTLVSYFATSQDLDWVLDGAQRDLLLRRAPGAFNDDRGNWGLVLAQSYFRLGDQARVREYSEEARKGFAAKLVQAPEHEESRVLLGLSLAYLGRNKEAVEEGERGLASARRPWNADTGPYMQHQLVRIYMLTGEHEKALDLLEPLMKTPYYLTPGWLRIGPNFDPLRKNPRFQKLVAGK